MLSSSNFAKIEVSKKLLSDPNFIVNHVTAKRNFHSVSLMINLQYTLVFQRYLFTEMVFYPNSDEAFKVIFFLKLCVTKKLFSIETYCHAF